VSVQEVRVPDLGDFSAVAVIEVLVTPGQVVAAEAPLLTLETEKATMDVPSPVAGTVERVAVAVGDKVSAGDLVITLAAPAAEAAHDKSRAAAVGTQPDASRQMGRSIPQAGMQPAREPTPGGMSAGPAPAIQAATRGATDGRPAAADLVVLGAGPGGYTAAFRAADLGLKVVLVERWPTLGGVCLNVGCIPSKALLHAARVIQEAHEVAECGIVFGAPSIAPDKLRGWKDKVVGQLARGLTGLARQRKIEVVHGTGRFVSPQTLAVEHAGTAREIAFKQCIIAAGSEPMRLPGLPEDARIIDSTGALVLENVPERLLVIGGGIIGLEMATVYAALGSRVSVVELTEQLLPGCDPDLVRPLQKHLQSRCEALMLGTRVTRIEAMDASLKVSFDGKQAPDSAQHYARVLVAVGRRPNGALIAADRAGVRVDERGYIPVDRQMRTNVEHIFAIGDIVGQPMLAHKATHEGRVAAEVCAGHKSHFDARVIPSVAYTDPEVAWVGLSETQAKADGIAYEKGMFPWAASARALTLGRSEGFTKLLFDRESKRLLGAGIVGPSAGDLIAEAALAIEMGCEAEDIGLTVHPHPTLSETLAFAAEAVAGTITDLYLPKR
jgi:dihydrolipoamide dehydrogenase